MSNCVKTEVGVKEKNQRNCAIVLAAGQGKRMNSSIQKQYILLQGKPVLWYSLQTFQQVDWINEIILVVGAEEEQYCQQEIVEKYGFSKVSIITAGGRERYESVAFGLLAAEREGKAFDYVYIHDGARPFITEDILKRAQKEVEEHGAVVVGMPAKDTIKIADESRKVDYSPARDLVWIVQTPQVFEYELILNAYKKLLKSPMDGITDDAMVLETYTSHNVYFVEGSYRNIKITTPEDLLIANSFIG